MSGASQRAAGPRHAWAVLITEFVAPDRPILLRLNLSDSSSEPTARFSMADTNKLELVIEVDVSKANALDQERQYRSVRHGAGGGKAARGASAGIDGLTVSMVTILPKNAPHQKAKPTIGLDASHRQLVVSDPTLCAEIVRQKLSFPGGTGGEVPAAIQRSAIGGFSYRALP